MSVLAVPRSIARSFENRPKKESKIIGFRGTTSYQKRALPATTPRSWLVSQIAQTASLAVSRRVAGSSASIREARRFIGTIAAGLERAGARRGPLPRPSGTDAPSARCKRGGPPVAFRSIPAKHVAFPAQVLRLDGCQG